MPNETNWVTTIHELRQLLSNIERVEGLYSPWADYPDDSDEAAVFSLLAEADGLIYQAMAIADRYFGDEQRRDIGIPRL